MRIISGSHKGKRIMAPKKLPVRPTTDMAKEALFNILNNDYQIIDLKILDLFSGTGNISLEFASRGCKNITAVEQNPGCIRFIYKISKQLNFPITIIKMDVFKFLVKFSGLPFDIIFADPPYDFKQEQCFQIIDDIFSNNFLTPNGVLIMEHSKHTDLSSHEFCIDQRKYGGNMFTFYKRVP